MLSGTECYRSLFRSIASLVRRGARAATALACAVFLTSSLALAGSANEDPPQPEDCGLITADLGAGSVDGLLRSPREVGPPDRVPFLQDKPAAPLCLAKPPDQRTNIGNRGKQDKVCVRPLVPAPPPGPGGVGAVVCELLLGNLMRAVLALEAQQVCRNRGVTCVRNGCPGPCYQDVAVVRDDGFSYAARDADCVNDPKAAKGGRIAACIYGNITFECVCECPKRPTPKPQPEPDPKVEP